MSIDVFKFPAAALAAAFDCGAHFFWNDPPFKAELAGPILTVRSEYGNEESVHEYQLEDVSGTPADLGNELLVSTVTFPDAEIAMAFACGLWRYAGAFVGIAISGSTVIVSERRAENSANELSYEYEILRTLIAAHRANIKRASSA